MNGIMYQLFDEKRQISHALTGLIKEIGRSAECDISIPDDPNVSRVHARFDRDGEVWIIVDLGSTNGTFVNGNKIAEARLRVNDVIDIGDTRLRLLPLADAERPVEKKTTNITFRTHRQDEKTLAKGLFGFVRTAFRMNDETDVKPAGDSDPAEDDSTENPDK